MTDEEQSKINNAVIKNSVVTSDLRTAINKKGIPPLLATDTKGVNKLYNSLDNEDKFEDGNDKYVRTPALMKELTEREENLYDAHKKAVYEHSKNALTEVSKNSKVEQLRQIDKARDDKKLPKVKKEVIKESNFTDELTGETIGIGEVHHKERVADNPRKQNDKENLIHTADENHRLIHHNDESNDDLEKLANDKNWNYKKLLP